MEFQETQEKFSRHDGGFQKLTMFSRGVFDLSHGFYEIGWAAEKEACNSPGVSGAVLSTAHFPRVGAVDGSASGPRTKFKLKFVIVMNALLHGARVLHAEKGRRLKGMRPKHKVSMTVKNFTAVFTPR